MSNLAQHPARPIRAITLYRVPGERDLWQAFFVGDQWTTGFRTPPGSRGLVRDAILDGHVRHGLPIVDEIGLVPPHSEIRAKADRDGWPGGHAA